MHTKEAHGLRSRTHLLEGWGIASILLAVLMPWMVAGGKRHDWSIPISYTGDALFSLQMIKRLQEGGWFFDTVNQGYPGLSNMLDFPASDVGLYVIQKLLGWLLPNPGWVFNVFYLAGFGAAAAAAYWVLRRLRITPILSFAAALSFAVAPYHFARLCHLMLSWYFVIPLFVYQALHVLGVVPVDGDDGGQRDGRRQHLAPAWWFAGAFVLGCFGVYYAFFGAMLIFAAGLFAWARGVRNPLFSMGLVATVFCAIVVNVTPNLVHRHTEGRNPEVAQRFPNETEVYAVKIVQLLMPPTTHRVRALNKPTGHYNDDFPLINENRFSALGMLGAAGFLLLVVVLLANQFPRTRDPVLAGLAFLLGVILLTSTVGGFSTLFALYVSPMIRAWNRVSIFIGFVSIAALALAMHLRGWSPRGRLGSAVFAVAVAAFVMGDQTPGDFPWHVQKDRAQYTSDRQFVRRVEASLPPGSAVLELPYMYFPEGPTLVKMETYDPGRPYLHSRTLKWSYGGIRGREADKVVRAVTALPVDEMVAEARRLGFAGIYVDRHGFKDDGQEIESALRGLLKGAAIVSPDRRLFFIPV